MGGRSASSGLQTFGGKTGVRLSPKQYKSAVNDEANMILRELDKQEALQIIIHKSFKDGKQKVTLQDTGIDELAKHGITDAFLQSLNNLVIRFDNNARVYRQEKKKSETWSGYDVARAKAQANVQAANTLRLLATKLKKKR